jgi:hypothetical protein
MIDTIVSAFVIVLFIPLLIIYFKMLKDIWNDLP